MNYLREILLKIIVGVIIIASAISQEITKTDESGSTQCTLGTFSCSGETGTIIGKCLPPSGVCNGTFECADASDEMEINCSNSTAPLFLTDNSNSSHVYVTRVYMDDHAAIYYDNSVDRSTTWPFELLSSAWKHVKDSYGSFGDHPRLFVILREDPSPPSFGCKAFPFLSPEFQFRNVIDCHYRREENARDLLRTHKWSERSSENFEKIFFNLGDLIFIGATRSSFSKVVENFAGISIFTDCFNDIIFYDVFHHLSKKFPQIKSWAKHSPKPSLYIFFSAWSLPLYNEYGETAFLSNLVGILKWYWTGQTNLLESLSHEELAGPAFHTMSEATGIDIEPFAAKQFNWGSEKTDILLKTRERLPFTNYTVTFADQHVLFHVKIYQFFPTWMYEAISKAWKYMNVEYGPLLLPQSSTTKYRIVFNNATIQFENGCQFPEDISGDYWGKDINSLHVIDCRAFNNSRNMDLDTFLEEVLIRSVTQVLNQGAVQWAPDAVLGWTMISIVVYDLYAHLNMTPNVNEWAMKRMSERSRAFSGKSGAGAEAEFILWYHTQIQNHNETEAHLLKSFFFIVNKYWADTERAQGPQELNMGQFVHIWSGAAENNLQNPYLQDLAKRSFGWNESFQAQSNEARISMPNLTYPLRPLKEAMAPGSKTRFYFKNSENYPNSTYVEISKAWMFTKDNYSPHGNESTLTIVLHNDFLSQTDEPCTTPNKVDITNKPGLLNVIDCSPYDSEKFKLDPPKFLDKLVQEMAEISLNSQNDGRSWPAQDISGRTITSILVYDVYISLGLILDTARWSEMESTQSTHFPREGTLWFKNWYLIIYGNHKNGTSVLKNFLTALNENWPGISEPLRSQLNMGEFVHFWSGAANKNLKDVAKNAFGWNVAYQAEFQKARIEFPMFNYLCDQCEDVQDNTTAVAIGVPVAAAVLIFIALGIVITYDRRRIKHLSQQIRKLTNDEINEFNNGNRSLRENDTLAIQALPFNNTFEVPRERLIIDENKILGTGEFGLVKKGLLKGDPVAGTQDLAVAVKMVKPNVEVSYFKAFLTEIKIMAHLEKHNNIASLLGTVTANIRNREVFVALEFCVKGDLLQHLRASCENFKDLYTTKSEKDLKCVYINTERPTVTIITSPSASGQAGQGSAMPKYENTPISTLNLLDWSQQIANGMAYLSSKKVIHGDLAARNVLLTENDVAKISDFGLSRQLVNYSNYLKESKTPVPWRWLAIESLEKMTYSIQSDVWAYGVTLWEIFTLGKVPYPGRNWTGNFVAELNAGLRLSSPEFGNEEIYNLMMNCMKKEPDQRIKFPQIWSEIENIKKRFASPAASTSNPSQYMSVG